MLLVVSLWGSACISSAQDSPGQIVAQARDIVQLNFSAFNSLSGRFRVSENGSITIPGLGEVNVILRDKARIQIAIETALRERLGSIDEFTVELKTDKHSGIMIAGAVAKPIILRKASGVTVADLVMAVPLLEFADPKRAVIYDITGHPAPNKYSVKPGDRIEIPVKHQVSTITISGGITRAGSVDLREGTTLGEAIALAGGVSGKGDPTKIFIDRIVTVGPLDLSRDAALTLQQGDQVRVGLRPEVPMVTVSGLVRTAKNIEWAEDLTLFKAIEVAGGVKDQRVTVQVYSVVNSKKKRLKFKFSEIVRGKQKDFKLEPGDIVEVTAK